MRHWIHLGTRSYDKGWVYTVRFSSNFEPNSDSCDSFFWVRQNFSFVVHLLTCSVQGVTRVAIRWSDEFLTLLEILVAPREGIAQLKQSYEPTTINSVILSSLHLHENNVYPNLIRPGIGIAWSCCTVCIWFTKKNQHSYFFFPGLKQLFG